MLLLLAIGPRIAVVGYKLEDGQYIPPGYPVVVDMRAVHFDPEIYPDPYRCDLFRFAKLRGNDSSDSKYSFSTIDATVSALLLVQRIKGD